MLCVLCVLCVQGQQQFDFGVHALSLSDDGLLSATFAAAQRSSAQEVPTELDSVHGALRVGVRAGDCVCFIAFARGRSRPVRAYQPSWVLLCFPALLGCAEVERMWLDTRVLAHGLRQRFTSAQVREGLGV